MDHVCGFEAGGVYADDEDVVFLVLSADPGAGLIAYMWLGDDRRQVGEVLCWRPRMAFVAGREADDYERIA